MCDRTDHPRDMNRDLVIAIDGTLASGKGTIARLIAAEFDLPHMDTGALYRATALAAIRANADFLDEKAVAEIASKLDLSEFDDRDLRTAAVGQAASKVAALPEVRAALLDLQRNFASQPGGAVLDGRDIGTIICPEADVKLWIDAELAERARRRRLELEKAGQSISQEDMVDHLRERDARDRSRETAPMQKADDAVLIETTDLDIDAAVDKARAVIEAVLAND
ncbi:MAG: (d)CMP kinase [Pseudomonadota bacterium]